MAGTQSLEQAGREADERLARVFGSSRIRVQQPRVSIAFEVVGPDDRPDDDGQPEVTAHWVIEGLKILVGAVVGAVLSDAMDNDDPQQGCTTTRTESFDQADGSFSVETTRECVS